METGSERPLGKRAARKLRSQDRRERETRPARRRSLLKRALWMSGIAAVLVGGIGGAVFYFATAKSLPPTNWTPGTHPESWPTASILSVPISFGVQQHIMEHDRGIDAPGIIVQYNCRKYPCDDDLVPRLEEVVRGYPSRVYLAPNPTMDAKIVLTTFKKREVLDEFDEPRIDRFIERALR